MEGYEIAFFDGKVLRCPECGAKLMVDTTVPYTEYYLCGNEHCGEEYHYSEIHEDGDPLASAV